MHSDSNDQHKGCNIMSNTDAYNTLAELAEEIEGEQPWLVDEILPAGGRLNIFAAPKAGKTTITANLVRAITTRAPFLDRYAVAEHPEAQSWAADPQLAHLPAPNLTALVFDTESTVAQLVDLYTAQGLAESDLLDLALKRGRAHELDLLNPARFDKLVERYSIIGADVVILDPVGPVLAALGLDENSNSDVQRFLTAWDRFADEIGARASVLVHHAGHNGGRARGASAFHGSGDVNLVLSRGEDAARTSWISTTGRTQHELPKTRLGFDPETRRLSLDERAAARAREDHATDVAREKLTEALAEHPDGLTGRNLEAALVELGTGRNQARAMVARAGRVPGITTGQHPGSKGTVYRLTGCAT